MFINNMILHVITEFWDDPDRRLGNKYNRYQ